jgi:RNA 2',3'-cyclic 3'-phosphodiesterase
LFYPQKEHIENIRLLREIAVNLSFASQTSPFQPSSWPTSVLPTRRLQRLHQRLVRPPQRRTTTDRLFLAVVPPADVAARIARLARHLKIGHDLTGKPLEPEHFHVTLCHLGDGIGVPSEAVALATERAASIAMPSFKVAFDRVESFRNGAFVMRGDDSIIGLEVLHQRLSDALDGSPQPARPFTPHVTLLRDRHLVPEHAIEPIEWQVRDVVLVHSLLGKTTHRHLARVPLGS